MKRENEKRDRTVSSTHPPLLFMFINVRTCFCYFTVEAITITAAERRDETATKIHKTSVATTQVSTKVIMFPFFVVFVWLYIPRFLKSD
jgi:hypothetical protein